MQLTNYGTFREPESIVGMSKEEYADYMRVEPSTYEEDVQAAHELNEFLRRFYVRQS